MTHRSTEIQKQHNAVPVKKLTVVLPAALWQAVKITAAQRGTTAQKIAHDALTLYLRKSRAA